jgi:hypothetical protein
LTKVLFRAVVSACAPRKPSDLCPGAHPDRPLPSLRAGVVSINTSRKIHHAPACIRHRRAHLEIQTWVWGVCRRFHRLPAFVQRQITPSSLSQVADRQDNAPEAVLDKLDKVFRCGSTTAEIEFGSPNPRALRPVIGNESFLDDSLEFVNRRCCPPTWRARPK